MVVVVGSLLAFAATSLKPMQDENIRKEKMQNILSTVGVTVTRDEADQLYKKYIKEELALKADGSADASINAFDVNMKSEVKKNPADQVFPLYIAEVDNATYYVVPLRGKGLWDEIWGYIALKDDINTVKGVSFDHKGETPGLGAEITQNWFQERFDQEKIFDQNGNLVGIEVKKGYQGGNDKDDNAVDAISGATITGDGVTDMIKDRLQYYLPYFKKINTKLALN